MGNQFFFIVGVMTSLTTLYRLLKFIYPYCKPSKIRKYLVNDAYALVTGSSDGIGKAVATELAGRGFNIILHGRSAEKIQAVEKEIGMLYPKVKITYLIHDGSHNSQMDISEIIKLNIKVLVNNVGVGPIKELTNHSNAEIDHTIILNTAFPTQLTRNLLPYMEAEALILNVSSYAGFFPPPYLSVYAATKAYNNAFSVSLAREVAHKEVISLITGSVNTGSNHKPVSFMRPAAATYAKHIIGVVGCGRKSIMPYWPHSIQTFLISVLPERFVDRATKKAMQKELGLAQ